MLSQNLFFDHKILEILYALLSNDQMLPLKMVPFFFGPYLSLSESGELGLQQLTNGFQGRKQYAKIHGWLYIAGSGLGVDCWRRQAVRGTKFVKKGTS